MGDMLSREQILAAEDIESEIVEVPEWGGSVLVRGMTGQQRDEWEASMSERRGKKYVPNVANIRAKLVVYSVIDRNGERLFTMADVEVLGRKSAAALSRVYDVAARLSGVTDQDVEELAENFGQTSGDGSSSPALRNGDAPSRPSSPTPAAES